MELSKFRVGETFELSFAEQVEVFKSKLEKVLFNSDLPISVIYLILKDISTELGREYEKFAVECRAGINKKIQEEQEYFDKQDAETIKEMQENGVNVKLD